MNITYLKRGIFFILLFAINASALTFNATIKNPQFLSTDKYNTYCSHSAKDLIDTYKTNYIAYLTDGTIKQYASLRFLAQDLDAIKSRISTIKVVDFDTQNIIDAKKAFFLVNSNIRSKYSKFSKVAFKDKQTALKYQKKYKGKIREFDFVLYMGSKDIALDESYFKKKVQRDYIMGEKIFKMKCDKDMDILKFNNILELKNAIVSNNICGKLNKNRADILTKYIWEIKRFNKSAKTNIQKVKVQKSEKCPVCGMFTYKYPRWAAQIFYEQNDQKKHWSFDGVKDLIKFYFNPMKWGDYKIAKKENITKILVTDYYTQAAIDGTKAYYVIRSDVYGPMGHEFIPFASKEDAKTFMKDHFGKKIIEFKDITEEKAYELDYNE